jgi:hypothetical protein
VTRADKIEQAARSLVAWWDQGDDDGDMDPTPGERVEILRAALALPPDEGAPHKCRNGHPMGDGGICWECELGPISP